MPYTTRGLGQSTGAKATGVLSLTATGASVGSIVPVYGTAVGAVIGAAIGIVIAISGASARWTGFAARLAATVQADTAYVRTLADRIQSARSIDNLQAAVREFNTATAHGRPIPSGPYDLLTPPGATGTAHEGGAVANFEPAMANLRHAIALMLQGARTTIAVTTAPSVPTPAPVAIQPSPTVIAQSILATLLGVPPPGQGGQGQLRLPLVSAAGTVSAPQDASVPPWLWLGVLGLGAVVLFSRGRR